ncbi:uncharacterized protein [Drosophila virilis]|uniref:Uncharacterized protein n=1 Tax=Drosophila virilis TaxID=7244 RepID=B4LW56_DROVI|nr:uncharacterized protein LOC6629435 [Drosophila virilis]EDW67590.1 uncharacterized protein Dvir_GJ22996 [Drosophila virilis]
MEYILKVAEEVDQQWAEMHHQQEENSHYKSVFTLNGKSILSPLMTPERRLEMQKHRLAAMAIEEQVERLPKLSGADKMQHSTHIAGGGCCRLVDASTNTELVQQPLAVVGRIKQPLQFSETLIYDNKCNAIIKFIKPVGSPLKKSPVVQMLCEEFVEIQPQHAVLREPDLLYATLSATSLETAEPMSKQLPATGCSPLQPQEPSACNIIPNAEPEQKANKKQCGFEAIRQLLDVAQLLKKSIDQRDRELLQRAITSPALTTKDEKEANNVPPNSSSERCERLHPQLWKRYHSYPLGYKLKLMEMVAPSSPNAAATADTDFSSVASPPSTMCSNSKIQVKQQHSTPEKHRPIKVAKTTPQKRIGNNNKSGKRTPRSSGNVSYAAHASSHANVQMVGSDSSTRMSSTQRRLSYDPRATLKREAALKKVESSGSCATQSITTSPSNSSAGPIATSADCSTAEQIKRKVLEEMEQQQRQRFQQLVAQQAEEQQRLQTEFLAQQQLLMEQMLCDISTITYDKDGQSDHANSETSSINSLPQSRLDLALDEPESGL